MPGPKKFPLESAATDAKLMQLVAAGQLHPHVSDVLALERAADAMNAVANRTVRGRVVLRCSSRL